MAKKSERPKWPIITVAFPDDTTGDLLRYWDYFFTPKKDQWTHPEDAKKYKKYRAAIKVLMPFFE